VAILSTQQAAGEVEDFDATLLAELDVDFLFGDRRLEGRVSPLRTAVEDVDGDGDLDLILHFSMEDIVAAGALDGDSVDAVLTAEFGGDAIGVDLSGLDSVRIVPPKTADSASVDFSGLDPVEIAPPKNNGKKK